jgi:hypothetical protein
MATNDRGAGPILGQQVLYQVTGTHAIVKGTINGINANGSVNICQNPAPGLDHAHRPGQRWLWRIARRRNGHFDNKWAYNQFF